MSLDALKLALHGLFPLSPIAAAVQGLIAQIQEEQRQQQVAGQRGRPGSSAAPDLRDGRPLTQADPEDLERIVREKWEAIERAQASESPSTVDLPPRPTPQPKPQTVFTPGVKADIRAQPSMTVQPTANDDRSHAERTADVRRHNAQALAVILAEID